MALIKTITDTSKLFHDLKAMGRDNFSYDGANALQEYLANLSDEIGENIDYDPIAFCCDFAEYSEEEYEGLAGEYSQDFGKGDDFDRSDFMNWLQDNTTIIEFTGGLVVQSF
tara:strand:- start:632 stop:967 length:336 start_codon:yes stop_codon:yes gene_type:complete